MNDKNTCIIFDMDGTLWNATEGVTAAYNEYLYQNKGWKNYLTVEDIISITGLEIEEIADKLFPQLSSEERYDLISECMAYENEYLSKHGGCLYPDVETTLQKLAKNHLLMIVTNADDGYVQAMFAAHDIGKYFVDFEMYGRTQLVKGENIKLIMKRNHITNAVYVGDTLKDQEACKIAGIPFIYASYGFGDVEHFDARINEFKELLQQIEKFG